ncbi:hypothetical protein PFISCL1PPCAC_12680, partial [Pristionchus fissidentatus]
FRKRPKVAHIDCARLLRGDHRYERRLSKQSLVPNDNLDMSCTAIRERVQSRSNPLHTFPIAFAKIVYKDYEFLEEQLAVSYSTEHTFCFSVDQK